MAARNEVNTGKRGRPRKVDVAEANKDRYSPLEIHQLWYGFRGSSDEITLIMDLALVDRNTAIDISTSFWKEYEREQRERHQNAQDAL